MRGARPQVRAVPRAEVRTGPLRCRYRDRVLLSDLDDRADERAQSHEDGDDEDQPGTA